MGSHELWQTAQVLIKQALFGATFKAGEQCYPVRICLVTGVLPKLLIVLFQLTVTNDPGPHMCKLKGR